MITVLVTLAVVFIVGVVALAVFFLRNPPIR